MASIDILSAVLCDEVRREASGTAMIVGATPIGVALTAGEKNEVERASLFLEAKIKNANSLRIRLTNLETDCTPIEELLELPYKQQIAESDPSADIDEIEVVGMLVVNKTNVEFGEPGNYTLQYRINDVGDWINVREYLFPEADET